VPPTVLVVDDDPAIRRVLADLLEDEGYRVLAAGDGLGAMALAEQDRPDVVLSDVAMRGMDGLALRLWFEGLRPPVPVILTSGIVPVPGGRSRFLAKPAELDEVLAAVSAALAPT
jgi:CheY-like chemotaxis protein